MRSNELIELCYQDDLVIRNGHYSAVFPLVVDLRGTDYYVDRDGVLSRHLGPRTFFHTVEEAEEAIALFRLRQPSSTGGAPWR